jgi:hypothetical protein
MRKLGLQRIQGEIFMRRIASLTNLGSALLLTMLAVLASCSDEDAADDDATGGGGTAGAAGTSGTSTGGGSGAGTGGSATGGTGGASSGGSTSGGTSMGGSSTGGSSTGGSATGGSDGGMSGAAGSSAGASGSGGSAGGGTVMPKSGMNFFVTSRGNGKGANLGGLDGADAFCEELATAVSTELGAKTWRAYLSTATVNARDRIGTGPWRNQAGVIVANNVTELHDQEDGQALDATWPVGDLSIALDETGEQVVNDVHDILTGTAVGGTVAAGQTCDDWTSESMTATAQVGHSNRTGGGRPPYFNATHTVGCAPSTTNRAQGTVTSGGGRGSIYCFALEPSTGP